MVNIERSYLQFFLPLAIFSLLACKRDREKSLFDGQTLTGWEGDIPDVWRVSNGAITGGSLTENVPHNYFLCTEESYDNFILSLKIRLTGEEGFINSGIQFRSRRLDDPPYEMEGYQADFGEGFWASLYDESRRNRTLTGPDTVEVHNWIRKNDWNDYVIRAEGRHILLTINGHTSVDYEEPDHEIPQSGRICIQIHGGGKAQVEVKDIFIKEL